jgi:ubiquinone/menaquinone biosynthesis C-methylase UbiE
MTDVSDAVAEQYQHYYDNHNPEEWRLGAIDKANNILELCSGLGVQSVLEVGCGKGSIINRLAELKFAKAYVGLDLSRPAIGAAQSRTIPGAHFEAFDGTNIRYADKTFDLAILSHVVEHLEHPRTLIREAQRVATRIFIEVPCEHTLRMKKDYSPTPTGHINFFTASTIRRLVQTCGLVVERQIMRDCSLQSMQLYGKYRGTLQHSVRRAALALAPGLAPSIFVYHNALLCR